MPGAVTSYRLKRLMGAASLALLANLSYPVPTIAATLRVSWASGTEADLAGYRLRYGTAPGLYDATVEVGLANSCELPGLEVDRRYYIVVTAVDATGNESDPSAEVSGEVPASPAPIPAIDAALEAVTHSIYALQGKPNIFIVYGRNLEVGATVDIGPGVTPGATTRTAQGNLQFVATVAAQALPGPRTVTVSNPDGGTGSRSDSLTVVKSPDINLDCHVDVVDLNALARAWNESRGESRYADAADFDGDGYIGPDDLAVFVQYYLRVFPGCP